MVGHLLRAICGDCGSDQPTLVADAAIIWDVIDDRVWASWECGECHSVRKTAINLATADNLLHLGADLAVL